MGGLIGNNKKRISMKSISLFSSNSNRKSSKCFQPPNRGVVGLGIVAALGDTTQKDPLFPNFKPNPPPVFAVSPTRSNPIPISKPLVFSNLNNKNKNSSGGDEMEMEMEMELSEEYTCVISHIGDNLIKKTEYFDGVLANQTHTTASTYLGGGDEVAALKAASFQAADFLKSCNLCNKHLHGLDIFMYRGEKAFCSEECRYEQMVKDERKEKEKEKQKKKFRGSLGKGSTTMKVMMMNKPSFEFSSSTPCSSPIQLIAGIVAA